MYCFFVNPDTIFRMYFLWWSAVCTPQQVKICWKNSWNVCGGAPRDLTMTTTTTNIINHLWTYDVDTSCHLHHHNIINPEEFMMHWNTTTDVQLDARRSGGNARDAGPSQISWEMHTIVPGVTNCPTSTPKVYLCQQKRRNCETSTLILRNSRTTPP